MDILMYILAICGMFMFLYGGGTIVNSLFKNEISNEDFYKMLEEEKNAERRARNTTNSATRGKNKVERYF